MAREFRIGPIVKKDRTLKLAREAALSQAAVELYKLDSSDNLLIVRGIGDILALVVQPYLGGWTYVYLRKGNLTARASTFGSTTQREAAMRGVQHTADLFMGHPHTPERDVIRGQEWVRRVGSALHLVESDRESIIEDIRHLRTERAKM